MPLSSDGRNAMLSGGLGNVADVLSLHTGNPGDTGANELAGGSYTREAVTWNAAAGGQRTNSGAIVFDVAGGNTVYHVGFWSDLVAGTFYGWAPLGNASPQACTVEADDDTLTSKAHGYSNNQQVVVFDILAAGVPTGLTEGTVYYVRDVATDTFKLETTIGGGAVNVTADGECWVQRCIPESFGSDGTLTIADTALSLDARLS